jgi:hypothetical protein
MNAVRIGDEMRAVLVFLAVFASVLGVAQSSSQSATVQVELLSTIRTKKARIGDEVKTRTVTPLIVEGTVVPVGSTVIGRIVAVQPDTPDTGTSFVTLAFGTVDLQHGKKVPLRLSLRAAMRPGAPSQEQQPQQEAAKSPPAGEAQPQMQILHGGSMTPHNDPTSLTTMSKGIQHPGVAAQTGSVIGMPNVTLHVEEGNDVTSTFRSSRKNLQLDSGLQLILKVMS